MTVSHLTRTRNQLWSDLVGALEGTGSNLTLSEEKLIAAARNTYGGSISAKTTSRADLIASLVNAAGGSVSASTHSEDEMIAALANALGGSVSANSGSFNANLAASVNAAEGGGAPEWVPEGALTVLDFKNGQYWFGDAEHTLEEALEENLDWNDFDPTKIVNGVGVRALGATDEYCNFVLTTAAADGLLPSDGGFTAVATYSNATTEVTDNAHVVIEVLDLPDYNVEWIADFFRAGGGQTNSLTSDLVGATPVGDAGNSHVAAFTMAPGIVEASVDGNAVATCEEAGDNLTATHIAVGVRASADVTATAILEKLVFYAPQETAALPGLSTP